MKTKLGKKVAKTVKKSNEHPAITRLRSELNIPDNDFNDTGKTHTDFVDNDSGSHSDRTRKNPCRKQDDSDHRDITHRGGVRESHTDRSDQTGSHSDSGNYRDYSDMTK